MQLRTNGRPSFQDEGVLKTREALVVPQPNRERRIHGVAEPHRADIGESLSVVMFRAPNDASKARARNSCGVVTLFTPNTAGVSQAIGVVARSAARSPATRTAFAGGQGPSHLQAATNATAIRMAKA